MKQSLIFPLATGAIVALVLPLSVFAHEHQVIQVGDKTYSIEIGSLNEPITVDDKSGVEFSVTLGAEDEEVGHAHDESASAVTGLERTLKVEVSAGDKKKTLDIKPGETTGSYEATFIPTVQTTYSYRIFGTIEGVPIEISSSCNPAGHAVGADDTTPVKFGEKMIRLSKKGAFGCPQAKEDIGFPEVAPSLYELNQKVEASQRKGIDWGIVGTILGGLGLIAGVASWLKSNKRS